MKALTYHGAKDIRYESMDDPKLESDTDIVVKVDKCAICGSDLHIYHGESFSDDIGYCIGHEAVGEVAEAGRGVRQLKVGDKVMISAAVGCGQCLSCVSGNVVNCQNMAGGCYGLSAALQGCQAEGVRVPAADFNARKIPDGVSLDQALMMTDSLATAWFGARNADIKSGGTVAVVGLGPIGLMAVESAFVLGASRVFAIDPVAHRRDVAASLGAEALAPDDCVEIIREATKGFKCDSVIEAVGHTATIRMALRLVRRRGTVSVIGVNQDQHLEFPMGKAFADGLTFRIGTCSVPEEWPSLVPLIQQGRLKPESYITHRFDLAEGAAAYDLFDNRRDGAMKVIFDL